MPGCETETVIETVDPDIDWRAYAACKGMWELFFPPDNEQPKARKKRETECKIVCRRCPVSEACLNYSFFSDGYPDFVGVVAGGKTYEERRKSVGIRRTPRLRTTPPPPPVAP